MHSGILCYVQKRKRRMPADDSESESEADEGMETGHKRKRVVPVSVINEWKEEHESDNVVKWGAWMAQRRQREADTERESDSEYIEEEHPRRKTRPLPKVSIEMNYIMGGCR